MAEKIAALAALALAILGVVGVIGAIVTQPERDRQAEARRALYIKAKCTDAVTSADQLRWCEWAK